MQWKSICKAEFVYKTSKISHNLHKNFNIVLVGYTDKNEQVHGLVYTLELGNITISYQRYIITWNITVLLLGGTVAIKHILPRYVCKTSTQHGEHCIVQILTLHMHILFYETLLGNTFGCNYLTNRNLKKWMIVSVFTEMIKIL